MSIAYLIAAFGCGVMACTLGACQTFVLTGLIGIAGMGVAAAMNAAAISSVKAAKLLFPAVANGSMDITTAVLNNLGPVIGNLSFDALFAPAIAFAAPIWAATYAYRKGYIAKDALCDSQNWLPLLEPIRKPDVLLAGGVGGVIGALIMHLITVSGVGIDAHATSILIACVICKLLAGESLVSPVPVAQRDKGNRFSPYQAQGWLGHLNRASMRCVIALFCGACFAYAEYQLMLNPITFSFAHVIGFLFGAVALIFAMMNFSVQVLPPITASACFVVKGMVIAMGNTPEAVAAIPPLTFMVWGAAGGLIGMAAAHVLIQVLKAFSPVYIDPPSCAIVVTSFLGFTVIAGNPALAESLVFPIIIIVLGIVYAVMEPFLYRKVSKAVLPAAGEKALNG